MSYPGSALVVVALALFAFGCNQSTDAPESEKPNGAQSPKSQTSAIAGSSPTALSTAERAQQPARAEVTLSRELLAVYEKLNIRSFPNSFGPRLKYHCESYLFEYFPQAGVRVDSATQMTLINGDDTWTIELLGEKRVRLETSITGTGSYHAVAQYDLHTIDAAGDLRADAAWIEQKPNCKLLNAGETTTMGLTDLRKSKFADGWICGDYWSGRTVTPALEYWKTLAKLPHEENPARNSWGATDMMRIQVADHESMSGRCARDEQLREVREFRVFNQPNGTDVGKFVRIWTYGGGLLDMMGFVALNQHGAHKVNFDAIAKEQLVLVITDKDEDWIDISTFPNASAWINLKDFEPHMFAVEHLPYLKRLALADELKLIDSTPRPVRSDASSDAEVVYTLSDVGTALQAIEFRNDWVRVRFVPPPDYPAINCGDNESDFNWINGWIRWRDGDKWYVTEEHHYGC